MDTKRVNKAGFHVVGIQVRTCNTDEADPSRGRIAGLWRRFMEEGIAGKVPRPVRPEIVMAVYTNYETDHRGMYSLVLGAEVADLEQVPPGMIGVTVSAGEYLVFTASGPMPRALIETWGEIWEFFSPQRSPARAYTADFEVHDMSGAGADVPIYIAVR
jgi:predicted transcriptional regulator YdeE